MRGEHADSAAAWMVATGSSPHARGTPPLSLPTSWLMGIIPACAGNTPTIRPWSARWWDHPRMRGEHAEPILRQLRTAGSSPHARGTPAAAGRYFRRRGIIPACAGNTRLVLGERAGLGDHPRMRGEHALWPCAASATAGSSPHARGTRSVRGGMCPLSGIIPACAGNTSQR